MSLDSGAKRMGWAVIDKVKKDDPVLIDSGIIGVDRKSSETYQNHKIKLIEYYRRASKDLLDAFRPNVLVAEIVPIHGFQNAAQSLLASTAATVFMAVTPDHVEIKQIAAISVKKRLTNNKTATKVAVRNKVVELYPQLKARQKEFKTIFDETDAVAIGHVFACDFLSI